MWESFQTHFYYLQRHSRKHNGEKPCEYKECGKSFSHLASLQSHSRTHTVDQAYGCKECGEAFTTLLCKCTLGRDSVTVWSVERHSVCNPPFENMWEHTLGRETLWMWAVWESFRVFHNSASTYEDSHRKLNTRPVEEPFLPSTLVRYVSSHTGEKPYD